MEQWTKVGNNGKAKPSKAQQRQSAPKRAADLEIQRTAKERKTKVGKLKTQTILFMCSLWLASG